MSSSSPNPDTPSSADSAAFTTDHLPRPGRGEMKRRLGQILRVDHAGELGAVHIYRGQRAVFGAVKGFEKISADLEEMEGHEHVHLNRFNALLTEHKVRPTLMTPLWRVGAFAMGAATALLGEKAAHACTEAVESVISDHYAGQIAELSEVNPELAAELTKFRDDEIMHHDKAVEEGAREAPGYPILSALIKTTCKVAIKVSEAI